MQYFASAALAEQAFYHAFTQCDLKAMSTVWAEGNVVCVHPGSDVLHGKAAVMQSWSRILKPGFSAKIEIEPISVVDNSDVAVHVVYEHLLPGAGQEIAVVIATNVYVLGHDGWQMVEHHGTQPVGRARPHTFTEPAGRVLQ